jgi:hypothetical protein
MIDYLNNSISKFIRLTLSICKSIKTILSSLSFLHLISSILWWYNQYRWSITYWQLKHLDLSITFDFEKSFILSFLDLVLFRSARLFSSTVKKKSPTNNDDSCLSHSLNHSCPICRCPYDNQKHKRLIDTTCQHEKCYTCMFKYEQCSICLSHLGEYI